MSSRNSSTLPHRTWVRMLPWLEHLARQDILELQKLGEPVEWWLKETPAETIHRCSYMNDVYGLLAVLLTVDPQMDSPFSTLLPMLPMSEPLYLLEIDEHSRSVLRTKGRIITLSDLSDWTPGLILDLPELTPRGSFGIITALVRSATNGSASFSMQSPIASEEARTAGLLCGTDAEESPSVGDALKSWLATLDSRELDTMTSQLTQATASPIHRQDLLDHHPWMSKLVAGTDTTVLDMLLAMRWSGTLQGGWLYSGDLQEAASETHQALSLEPGEHISITTAKGIIATTGLTPADMESWLRFCGLHMIDGQIVASHLTVPPISAAEPAVPIQAISHSESSDFVAALGRLSSFACELDPQATLEDILLGAQHLPEELQDDVQNLLGSVPGKEMWELAKEEETETLESRVMAVLRRSQTPLSVPEVQSRLSGSVGIGEITSVLVDAPCTAITTAGVWCLVAGQQAKVASTQGGSRSAKPTSRQRPSSQRQTLKTQALEALEEAGYPLHSQMLADRMGGNVKLQSLRVQLAADARFIRSDVDAWALADWGLRPYRPIKELVAEEIDKAGGSIPTANLIRILTHDFSIMETSLRQVASTPPFTANAGVVRRLADVSMIEVESGDERSADKGAQQDDEPRKEAPDGLSSGPSTDELLDIMGLS